MAWWWAIPAAIGLAKFIYDLFDEKAREARSNWEQEHARVELTVEEHTRKIGDNLAAAQQSYEFHFLSDLHFSSQQVAANAYSLLEDARTCLEALGRMLVETAKKRDELKCQLDDTRDWNARRTIFQQLDELKGLANNVRADKDTVKSQRDYLRSEVSRLNQYTRQLKLAIRDRCGQGGRLWFDRLEQRTAARRQS